jgi:hypothetical protein
LISAVPTRPKTAGEPWSDANSKKKSNENLHDPASRKRGRNLAPHGQNVIRFARFGEFSRPGRNDRRARRGFFKKNPPETAGKIKKKTPTGVLSNFWEGASSQSQKPLRTICPKYSACKNRLF